MLDLFFPNWQFLCMLVMFNKTLSLNSLSEGELKARINLEKHSQKMFTVTLLTLDDRSILANSCTTIIQ